MNDKDPLSSRGKQNHPKVKVVSLEYHQRECIAALMLGAFIGLGFAGMTCMIVHFFGH